ncbi:hypothetical protein FQA39_LY00730 [Lamprigera yunnana]|nr:hypothetical protein FQA39_LY00730 [Lamprigera yunnana]
MDRFTIEADHCEEEEVRRKRRKVRKKKYETLEISSINVLGDIEGVQLITISQQVQRFLKCVVGSNVSTQIPWMYVSTKHLVEHLEAQDGMTSQDFMDLKDVVKNYPKPEMLLCYKTDDDVDYEQYFICLTTDAENAAMEVIELIKNETTLKLSNAITKKIRPWKSHGSEVEVTEEIPKNNRALLEVEIETDYPIMTAKCLFKIKMVKDARDGYVSILPGRGYFANIIKKRLDVGTQVTPPVRYNSAQTVFNVPKNVWTQYSYEYVPIKLISKDFRKDFLRFVNDKIDDLSDNIYINGYINFYTNDYVNLIAEPHTFTNKENALNELFAFVDFQTCKAKTITTVAWHPMWTGIVAVAYSDRPLSGYAKGKYMVDEVSEAIFNVTPILIWSFNDSLYPKLYLESPREITALSFCPYNEHLLVELVELEEVLTVKQQYYRKSLFKLVGWMRNTRNIKNVKPVVTSNLQHSHKDAVIGIKWMSCYREVYKNGQIRDIPQLDDTVKNSLQFWTSSIDGSVMVWDLNVSTSDREEVRSKRTRLKTRPEGLVSDVSPFRVLNRIFKPFFKITVGSPHKQIVISKPLTFLELREDTVLYEDRFPDPKKDNSLESRVFYNTKFVKPDYPIEQEFVAGTAEGELIRVSWEGFLYNAAETLNIQPGKVESILKVHDGPIVATSTSLLFPNLILTVGGKVFALWLYKEFDAPVFWRKSKHRLFSVSAVFCTESEAEKISTYKLCQNNVKRKQEVKKWQNKWNTKNQELIKQRKYEEEARLQRLKEEKDEKKRIRELEADLLRGHYEQPQEPVQKYDAWRLQEEKRMRNILLGKKDYDIDLLKKQQQPLIKMNKDNEDKQIKLEEKLKSAGQIYSGAVERLFPEVAKPEVTIIKDPYEEYVSAETKLTIYDNYLNKEEEAENYIKNNKYSKTFNWFQFLNNGKLQRKYLDGSFMNTSHKDRLRRAKK